MDVYKMKLEQDKSIEELKSSVMEIAELFASNNEYAARNARHLRLAAEETMEMLRILGDRRPDELCLEKEENGVVLRLITNEKDASTCGNPVEKPEAPGIAGMLSMLYGAGYKGLEQSGEAVEELGVRKAPREDLADLGFGDEAEAYVWTLQSYNMEAFDHSLEDDEAQWQQVSHSILANLSDDIRLIIFREKTELDVRLATARGMKTIEGKYAISAEFEKLLKIPVFKTRFQVKMVRLLYGRLDRKQKSNEKVEIRKIQLHSDWSKKGSIKVLRYDPVSARDTDKAVIFFHGGADLFPALPYHYRLAEKIAVGASCRVFLVMHDLAPEFNPPVQIHEAMEVYRQLIEKDEYPVYPGKVAIMGDSSGGTMTAAVALLARDGLAPQPAGQLLLYPSLDMRYNTESMKIYRDVPIVNGDAIDSYRKIVHTDWSEGNKYYLSPAEAASCEGLCPAYVETAEFDALHDEGVEYAKKMEKDGVRVILNETKGTVHSFDMAENSSIVEAAVKKRIAFLNEILR